MVEGSGARIHIAFPLHHHIGGARRRERQGVGNARRGNFAAAFCLDAKHRKFGQQIGPLRDDGVQASLRAAEARVVALESEVVQYRQQIATLMAAAVAKSRSRPKRVNRSTQATRRGRPPVKPRLARTHKARPPAAARKVKAKKSPPGRAR